jgi:hypothetical protein
LGASSAAVDAPQREIRSESRNHHRVDNLVDNNSHSYKIAFNLKFAVRVNKLSSKVIGINGLVRRACSQTQ